MPANRINPQKDHRNELADTPSPYAHVQSPVKQSARRRAYAKRSCLKCREKKARCELPEVSLTTPSSMAPLSSELACHRCKVLSLDCVVWDGDRKRRPKVVSSLHPNEDKSSSDHPLKPEPGPSRLPSSPPRSPGSLEQLAAAAARLSDHRSAYDDADETSPHAAASSNDASSSREAASTLASVQFFNPLIHDVSSPAPSTPAATVRAQGHSYLNASSAASSTRDYIRSNSYAKSLTPGSAASPNPMASSAHESARTQPPGRTWTSLWRPLSVLIDYAAQQPSFTTYLLSRIDRNLTDLDILDLIPRQTLSYLKPFLRPYLLWHPHLPDLDQIYAEHRKRPAVSSALLLSSMCLVAGRHAMPLTDSLLTKLSTLVDQLGTQILLSNPRDTYTVQALELLLAHEPSLVGTSVAGSAQAERGNGLLGESLLAAALTIARGLDLDKAIDSVVDICDRPRPTDSKLAQQRRELLAKHMAGASIWLSLRLWEGHFSFVNSTVRPIELSEIVSKAQALVAIDNEGRKIEQKHRDPFLSTDKRFPGLDEDSVLRSAGRTGLVYRLQAMARFQDTIAEMYRILATAQKPEKDCPASLMPTTAETRQEILDLLTASSQKQLFWQATKSQAFSPFASVRPALLLEDWATMESYSLQELLPCLAICAFMTGELNQGFSANEMVEALRSDASFCQHSSIISERRDTETHGVLSAFHLFDRGLGYSQPDVVTRPGSHLKKPRGSLWIEATGAPLLLTTAFATDACKTFLEKTACSLHGFDFLPVTVDMHIVMMINTIHRLDECDHNEYTPPTRSKKTSMPPPSRRLPSLTPDLPDGKPEALPGKSISQIGVLFVEEMVQVMQKWKLGASLQRTVPLHFRHLLGKAPAGTATKSSSPQHPPANSSSAFKQSPGARPLQHEPTRRSIAPSIPASSRVNGDGDLGNNMIGSINGNDSVGTLNQAQFFPQSFQTSFIPGITQPPASTATTTGMFDIPSFDLFGAASTMDWTNNVPWFDPIDSAAQAPTFADMSLPSFGNGHATSQLGQHTQPSQALPSQVAWPVLQRKRSSDVLPPLQHNSAHPPPPPLYPPSLPPPVQSHAHHNGYLGYPTAGPHSDRTYSNAYGEQFVGQGQSQTRTLSNNGADHHHHHHHHYQQQQHQPSTYHHHRSYYGGGGNPQGGR